MALPSRWSLARWPEHVAPWLLPQDVTRICPPRYQDEASEEEVAKYLRGRLWVWPGRDVVLLTDLHADADAFLDSLEAAGVLNRSGPAAEDTALTPLGRNATLVLAGDFLDKGPHNLALLRTVRRVRELGAQTVVLAGNHDIRTLVGVSCFGEEDPRLTHMFVRMGKKSVRLFHEIHQDYTKGRAREFHDLSEAEIRSRIAPTRVWRDAFPELAREYVSDAKITRELIRIDEKYQQMLEEVARSGMSLVDYYAAVCAFRDLFLNPNGEFGWLFSSMQLAHREGAVLFLHAGVDDSVAQLIRRHGHAELNRRFMELVESQSWFELYNGPVGNVFRTKYRATEPALTSDGVQDLGAAGVRAIAHGHRNITLGQRMIFREGMLNFECDASIDRNTRALMGLSERGAAATVFRADGSVIAVSSDCPSQKIFDPARYCPVTLA